jgi:hypothetical protein
VPGRGTFVIEQRSSQARRGPAGGRQRPHPHVDH